MKSPATYFISADGAHDSFERGAWSYYVTNVLLFIYGAGIIASLALLQNAIVLHTNTLGNDYGPLYSDRFVTGWWWALFFGATRVFLFMCVCSLLLYRKSSRWCNILWMVPISIFIIFDVGALTILAGYLGACNGNVPGNFNNPCNALNWCCDPRIFSNPDNHCRPTSTCPTGQAQALETMRPNSDFLWLFSLSVVAVVFDLYFFALPMLTGLGVSARSLRSALDVARERLQLDMLFGRKKE